MDKDAQKFIDDFYKQFPDRKIIFLVSAGSHFFNLNTPNSDKDFRGIYMPSPKEFYDGESKRRMIEWSTSPGNVKNLKNTNKDVDFVLFSVTKFLELLKRGDFNMMELLHAPDDKILINSDIVKNFIHLRSGLMVNDISSFLGFIKKEYKRYGVNMYHYAIQENFINFLKTLPVNSEKYRMKHFWEETKQYIAEKDRTIKLTTVFTGSKGHQRINALVIARRCFLSTERVQRLIEQIQITLDKYGHRQRSMAKDGVEYKGLYHAMRLIYEANDLYDYGEFKIPFSKERHKFLLDIKTSNIDQNFLFDTIDKAVEDLYNREKEIKNNKYSVGQTIDKLIFKIEGENRIKYLMEKK